MSTQHRRWYRSKWWLIAILVILFPWGLYLMWTNKPSWRMAVKVAVTVVIAAFWVPTIIAAAVTPPVTSPSAPNNTSSGTPTSTPSPIRTKSATTTPTPKRAKKSASASSTPKGPKLYAVGQTMTNGAHQTVTVTAFAQGVTPSAYSTPTPGDQCISVQVAVFNGDSSPWDLPLDELTAVDASGQSYDSYSSFDCPSGSSIDSLVPGGRASGTLYFEVPLSGRLLLQWTPSVLNPNSVYNTELKAS